MKQGLLKNRSSVRDIDIAQEPFGAPAGWLWCSLAEVFAFVTDGDHQPPPKTDMGVPFLVIGNINRGTLDFGTPRMVPRTYYDTVDWARKPRRGDILYTVVGSFGVPVAVRSDRDFCVQRHIAILKATRSTPVDYMLHALRSPTVFDQAAACATGTAQKTVPLKRLREILVPLPPFDEQRRIVTKVNELMALCDALEAHLQNQETISSDFSAASVHATAS